MTTAASGALIIEETKGGAHTNKVLYKRRCDNCGGFDVYPFIFSVQLLVDGPEGVYGTYHLESFECLFCGNHQVVKLER